MSERDLRAVAEKATPGRWSVAAVDGMGFAVHRGEHDTVARFTDSRTASTSARRAGTGRCPMLKADQAARLGLTVAFLATILAANYVTTEYGLIPVGFGLTATAGTYFAGLMFVLRDSIQDTAGRVWAIVAIAAGAVLSFAVADPFIALASGVAFGVSEIADLAVYTPLRRRGYVRAAVASNVVGAVVDTLLFLWIAGFGVTGSAVGGQLVGKLTVTAVVVGLVLLVRTQRKAATA